LRRAAHGDQLVSLALAEMPATVDQALIAQRQAIALPLRGEHAEEDAVADRRAAELGGGLVERAELGITIDHDATLRPRELELVARVAPEAPAAIEATPGVGRGECRDAGLRHVVSARALQVEKEIVERDLVDRGDRRLGERLDFTRRRREREELGGACLGARALAWSRSSGLKRIAVAALR